MKRMGSAGSWHDRDTDRRDSQRKRGAIRKGGNCNGEAIMGDYSMIDNMSPRMGMSKGNAIQKIFYQVLINNDGGGSEQYAEGRRASVRGGFIGG